MIIVSPSQPATRPPIGSGPPLENGDIWQVTATGVRQRYQAGAWSAYAPVVIRQFPAPTVRPAGVGGGPLQPGDLWINNNSGAQATWDGAEWLVQFLPAGIVPFGGLAEQHLAKATDNPFDLRWVAPAEGIAYLHQQQTPARVWNVSHDLRSQYVAVTCINLAGDTTMIPDIRYLNPLSCTLTFAEDTSGYAVVHASVQTPHAIV